ncbi:MAG: nitrogenase iron-molybdenum cofactor biosynthesis protein NifE [Nitrospirota bacterium]
MMTGTDKFFEHSCRPDSAAGLCRSRGGESCAFDGSMIVLQCIADAAHLVHGPIACFGNSWESRGTVSDKGILHKRAYTTDIGELDIVYGCETKLLKAIRETARDSGAKAIFVYSTCVTGLIGEDMDAVCKKAEQELGVRVMPVHAPGFTGPKNLGNRIAGDVLLDNVIGTGEPDAVTPADINLIGEYNIAGDLSLVEPVLKKTGINVLSRITGNSTFKEITYAHRAKLNVVVCGRALINVAKEMERRYGIPYIEVSFFGKTEMSKALRSMAACLKAQGMDITKLVSTVVDEEEAKLTDGLASYSSLKGKKAVLYTGGVKSWSFISALGDLGIDVVAVGAKKSTYEDEEKMKSLLGRDAPIHENMTPKNILTLMKEHEADILIAGGRNQYLVIKEGFPFVDVNQERHTAYAGYDGLVNLAGSIKSALEFYRPAELPGGKAPAGIPRMSIKRSDVSINPLKHSQSIGAAMALQGVDKAMVILHGAQGCNFLGKVLLTKHFREPISMMSTKLFAEDVVMGSEEKLSKAVWDVMANNLPEIVGVLTTGLVEVKGENVAMALGGLKYGRAEVVHISTPDYKGGLEEGYAAAVEGLVALATPGVKVSNRINILVGSSLTPADVHELRNIVKDFGLETLILPDLSALDGSRQGFSPLPSGGLSVEGIRSMGKASITLVVGPSLERAGRTLMERCSVPYVVLDGLAGLAATDGLLHILYKISGRETPERYQRERKVLVDGMRDAMAVISGKRIALAQEVDAAVALSSLIAGTGARVKLAVVPSEAPGLGKIIADEVVVGDYGSLKGAFDLLIAGSHGRQAADALRIPHLEWGFPVFEKLGFNASLNVGYRGSLELVNRIGNALMEARR